jgi:hypothetical protein
MKLIIIDKDFMYQVEDIPKNLLSKVKIYVKDDDIYLKIEKELTKIEMMKLLENSTLIYNYEI